MSKAAPSTSSDSSGQLNAGPADPDPPCFCMAGSITPPVRRRAFRLQSTLTPLHRDRERLLATISFPRFADSTIAQRRRFRRMPMPHRPTLELAVIGNCSCLDRRRGPARLGVSASASTRIRSSAPFSTDDRRRGRVRRRTPRSRRERADLRRPHGDREDDAPGFAWLGHRVRDFAPCFANYGDCTDRPCSRRSRCSPVSPGSGSASPAGTTASRRRRRPAARTTSATSRRDHAPATTDAPLAYIEDDAFHLGQPIHLILGPDETWKDPIAATVADYEEQTRRHWLEWVRGLSIPEWQEAVIGRHCPALPSRRPGRSSRR